MENKLIKLSLLAWKNVSSAFTALITYLTFWQVDSKQMDFTITHNHISYLIAALLVGFGTWVFITVLKIIIEKIVDERSQQVNGDIKILDNAIDRLSERLFIHDVIAMRRVHSIFPERQIGANNKIIERKELVENEIKDIRENFRLNRDTYKIPLDTVEDQLKRMYRDFYDGKIDTK